MYVYMYFVYAYIKEWIGKWWGQKEKKEAFELNYSNLTLQGNS